MHLLAFALQAAFVLAAAAVVAEPLPSAAEHFQQGERYLESGKNAEAAAAEFVAALKILPGHPNIHDALGRLLLESVSPRSPERLIELLGALEDGQTSAEAYYWLARAYQIQGDKLKALGMLQLARTKSARVLSPNKLDELQKTLQQDNGDNGPFRDLAVEILKLAALLTIAFLFVLGLRHSVIPMAPPLLVFLVIVLVLGFIALASGLIDGDQFIRLVEQVTDTSKPAK